ncbi:zinc ribbon domain-containing protein [Staphylococcus gallinarum]|uniref:FmdB family zinc ribbon protein n=1 Tax=Staphylococcus gallinarum TaxID=1293 RepID=UPI0030BD66F9
MPNYTYNCVQCHEFTIKQSIHDNHDIATCPTCGNTAKRIFTSFQTYNMNPKVKKRIEAGQQPRLFSGDKLKVNTSSTPRSQTNARPWMAGH